MNTAEYKTMADRENSYWWHKGRYKILEKQLEIISGKRHDLEILNIGCGTGGTVPTIERFGNVTNVDTADEAIRFMLENGYKAQKVTGISLPFKKNQFDAIVALDVLEHIEQDVEALSEWSRLLKPTGQLILTVPAYSWLWSKHDESLHHYRRYTRSELRKKVQETDLELTKNSYAIVFSFPLIVAFRFLTKLRPENVNEKTSYVNVPNIINSLFFKFLSIEALFLKYISFPFGTSVLIRAEKQNEK